MPRGYVALVGLFLLALVVIFAWLDMTAPHGRP